MNGKIFVAKTRMRMEWNYKGHTSAMIVDSEKNLLYRLLPEQHTYMKMDVSGAGEDNEFSKITNPAKFDANAPCRAISGAKCQKLGTELVNGRLCDKWNVVLGDGK